MKRDGSPGWGYLLFALLAGAAVLAAIGIESRVDNPHERKQALALAVTWAGATLVTALSLFASIAAFGQALKRYRGARSTLVLSIAALLLSAALLVVCVA